MIDNETGICIILKNAFNWKSEKRHWIKEVYLSSDEKCEIKYLLRGLNPDIYHLKVKKFCNELGQQQPPQQSQQTQPEDGQQQSSQQSQQTQPEDVNEKTRLNAKSKSDYNSIESKGESGRELTFIELVNQIESEATQKVNEKYFNLGKALAKCLETCSHSIHGEPLVKEISKKFPSHEDDVKKIYRYYFEFEQIERGITLEEFFVKHHPSKNLCEEIKAAHNALIFHRYWWQR